MLSVTFFIGMLSVIMLYVIILSVVSPILSASGCGPTLRGVRCYKVP